MYSLTIVFGQNHSVVWTMMFRDAEKAEAARQIIGNEPRNAIVGITPNCDITDDFGQRITLHPAQVIAVMLEDMSLSRLGHVERNMAQAYIQSESQQRYEADPKLRIARSMQGPSMISPMGNGRM